MSKYLEMKKERDLLINELKKNHWINKEETQKEMFDFLTRLKEAKDDLSKREYFILYAEYTHKIIELLDSITGSQNLDNVVLEEKFQDLEKFSCNSNIKDFKGYVKMCFDDLLREIDKATKKDHSLFESYPDYEAIFAIFNTKYINKHLAKKKDKTTFFSNKNKLQMVLLKAYLVKFVANMLYKFQENPQHIIKNKQEEVIMFVNKQIKNMLKKNLFKQSEKDKSAVNNEKIKEIYSIIENDILPKVSKLNTKEIKSNDFHKMVLTLKGLLENKQQFNKQ